MRKPWNERVRSRPVTVAKVDEYPPVPTGEPVPPVCPQHNGSEASRDPRRPEDKYARAKNIGE